MKQLKFIRKLFLGVVFISMFTFPAYTGSVIYVDIEAIGNSNAHGWDSTFTGLQKALDAAVLGDMVMGAEGTEAYEFSDHLRLSSAVSRKTHGAAGDFDIDLPLDPAPGEAGGEIRSDGPTKAILYFTKDIACGGASLSCGTLERFTIEGNFMTIEMSGVPNQCCLCITLMCIIDLEENPLTGVGKVYINVFQGDVNGDGVVDTSDIDLVKANLFNPITEDNFRCDVNVDGIINISDLGLVKANLYNTPIFCPED